MDLERIFVILILLTPLVIVPKMELGWEIGKIYWFWTIVEAWLWWRIVSRKIRFVWDWPTTTLLVWLGLALLSSVFAGGNAFWGGWWRRQGFWFMGHLGLAFWLFASTSLSAKLIHKIMVHVGILFLVAGLLVGGKWSGTILESNNYAIIAVVVFILSLDSRTLVPMVLAPIAIIFAESRSALLSMVVLAKYVPKKIFFLILVATLGFLIWFSWLRGSGGRWELWGQSLVLWKQYPWLGIGLDNFQTAFSVLMQGKGLQWANYDQPHNLILWLLVSTGSLGLASFIGWITTIFLSAKRTVWLKIALAMLIFGQFQPFSVSTWVYLFIVLACSL